LAERGQVQGPSWKPATRCCRDRPARTRACPHRCATRRGEAGRRVHRAYRRSWPCQAATRLGVRCGTRLADQSLPRPLRYA
jgi:hypothetical protein